MPAFTYTGDAGLYYPFLNGGLTPEPGSTHELDEAPTDGRWTEGGKPKTKPVVVDDANNDDNDKG